MVAPGYDSSLKPQKCQLFYTRIQVKTKEIAE